MQNEEDAVTEAMLARLTPAAATVDPVAAAYAAGRAAGRRGVPVWRAATAVSLAAVVTLAARRPSLDRPTAAPTAAVVATVPHPPPAAVLPDSAWAMSRAVAETGTLPPLSHRRPSLAAFHVGAL